MKFTVTLTDIKLSERVGVYKVCYRVEGEAFSFSGVEYFEGALPETMLGLNEETAERVRAKMIDSINKLPNYDRFRNSGQTRRD